jgi:hypothetical protein
VPQSTACFSIWANFRPKHHVRGVCQIHVKFSRAMVMVILDCLESEVHLRTWKIGSTKNTLIYACASYLDPALSHLKDNEWPYSRSHPLGPDLGMVQIAWKLCAVQEVWCWSSRVVANPTHITIPQVRMYTARKRTMSPSISRWSVRRV